MDAKEAKRAIITTNRRGRARLEAGVEPRECLCGVVDGNAQLARHLVAIGRHVRALQHEGADVAQQVCRA